MKRVYFHIGLPKTGTTSIQSFLYNNAAILREQGVVYPGRQDHPLLEGRGSHPVFLNAAAGRTLVSGTSPDQCREAVQCVFKSFREDAGTRSLIWSHESISMSMHKLDWPYLVSLVDGLQAMFVIYARFTDDLMESLYHQNIWGRADPLREQLYGAPLPGVKGRLRIMPHLSMVAQQRIVRKHFPGAEMKVRSYEGANAGNLLLSDALAALGIEPTEEFASQLRAYNRLNASRPIAHTMLLHRLERAEVGFATVNSVAQALKALKGSAPSPADTKRYRFLDPAATLAARTQYAVDREAFPNCPRSRQRTQTRPTGCLAIEP